MPDSNWLVRPGAGGAISSQVIGKKVVAIGWPLIGDLSSMMSLEEIRARFLQVYPSQSPRQVGFAASQLYTFKSRIDVGDVVLVPVPLERKVWLGRVKEPYRFDKSAVSSDYPHVRGVEWLREVAYEDLSPKLRSSIETPRTVFSLQERVVEVRRLVERETGLPEPHVYHLPRQRLTRVHLEHFKAFDEHVNIELAPVTLIAGTNSSGKTSILQSLLLARQTLITPYRAAVDDALKYDGDLVRSASFSELVFGKPTTHKSGMKLGFVVQTIVDSYAVHEYFGSLPQDAGSLDMSVDLDTQFEYDRGRGIVVVRRIVLGARITHDGSEYAGPTLTIEPEGAQWRLGLRLGGEVQEILEDMLSVNRFIPIWEIRGRPRTQIPQRRFIYDTFRSLFVPALELLRTELEERLFYVGPLRSAPQRPYLRQSVVGLDVGTSGEAAIQLLHERWKADVDFVSLPGDLAGFQPVRAQAGRMKLSQALAEALRLLGMEQELRIKKQGESYEAELSLLSKPDRFVSIVDVGFGVSQILPIIAVGLLSSVDDILIFEQPEIHLHPRAQAGLAELFLCLARTGRRILVETHSEHLINRLRRRVAENEGDDLSGSVNILFVQPPDSSGQGARVQVGRIDGYGQIENWPPGFLAEGAQDARAIMMAAAGKRLKNTAQRRNE